MRIKRVWPRIRRLFHVRKGEPYFRENSIQGINAAAKDHDGIDLDMQMSKPCKPGDPRGCGDPDCVGHGVGTHWGTPLRHGFIDPLRRIDKDTRIRDLYIWEIRRLIARDGNRIYRIQRIERLILQAARKGIVAVLEPKGDPRFEQRAFWDGIAKYADQVGAHLAGYSIRHLGGRNAGVRRVAAMRAAGIDAHVIH